MRVFQQGRLQPGGERLVSAASRNGCSQMLLNSYLPKQIFFFLFFHVSGFPIESLRTFNLVQLSYLSAILPFLSCVALVQTLCQNSDFIWSLSQSYTDLSMQRLEGEATGTISYNIIQEQVQIHLYKNKLPCLESLPLVQTVLVNTINKI